MTTVDPQEIYAGLISGKVHPRKLAGLAVVHAVCQERFDSKAGDWSISSIGRASATRGGPGPATLHLPRQEYYRALIKAWEAHAERKNPRAKQKDPLHADQWIQQIDDISARQMVLLQKKDLERARAEIQMLKKLLPNGGVIRLVASTAPTSHSETVPASVPPSARRDIQKFLVDGLFDDINRLKQLGLLVSKVGDVVFRETGEILFTAKVVEVLRSLAKKPDS
jgi:hypothetical protein